MEAFRMRTEVLVIGGGQAGLAAAFFLARSGIPYVVLDKGSEVGEAWKRRYDSLTLFTPRNCSRLPGMRLAGDPDDFPTKDEIARALRQYVEDHGLHIRLGTEVTELAKAGDAFEAVTNRGTFFARHVIVATGPFQEPWIPPMAGRLDPDVVQLHSARYRNPGALRPGTALVVGGGNSGAQIAVELAANRRVVLSAARRMTFLPLTVAGKSVFRWFDALGLLNAPADSPVGRIVRKRPDPVFGLELKRLIAARRILLKPRAVHASGRTVRFEDGSVVEADNIIWATGFRSDYRWLRIPGALDDAGAPLHERGASPVDGLYYVRLPWQTSRNSALIGGVGRDAEAVVRRIAAARDGRG
jgi:putative flavoprotein involved in K+ transport